MNRLSHETLRTAYEQAIEYMASTIDHIDPGAWDRPSPCSEWSVRDVVNHIVAECLWVEPLLDRQTIEQVGTRFDGDVLGNDPIAAWANASKQCATAFANTADLSQPVNVSWGQIPAFDYLEQMTADLTIHAWDIARGSGQQTPIPQQLVGVSAQILKPMVESGATGGVFEPPLNVGTSADAETQLLAMTGRSANWPS